MYLKFDKVVDSREAVQVEFPFRSCEYVHYFGVAGCKETSAGAPARVAPKGKEPTV